MASSPHMFSIDDLHDRIRAVNVNIPVSRYPMLTRLLGDALAAIQGVVVSGETEPVTHFTIPRPRSGEHEL